MRVLLFGGRGQVGWELQRSLAPIGKIYAPARDKSSELCGDIADFEGISRTIDTIRPDVIFNAAAYTNVDGAELEPDVAFLLNARAPSHIALEAKRCGAFFIHYSTDYVFSGEGCQPWREEDEPAPINQYGKSKLEGEIAILNSGVRGLIIRTSWVFAARRRNFLRTIFNLAKSRDMLEVVSDQFGSPTSAEFIADVSVMMALKNMSSRTKGCAVYHLCARGEVSWHEYAQFIIEQAERLGSDLATKAENISPIRTGSSPRKARRPLYSTLCCDRAAKDFDIHIPDWSLGVERVLSELLESHDD